MTHLRALRSMGQTPASDLQGARPRAAEIPIAISFVHSARAVAVELKKIFRRLDACRPLIVFGATSKAILGHSIVIDLRVVLPLSVVEVASASLSDVAKVEGELQAGDCDVVVGIGGGRALDVAKFAAFEAEKPFIAVPTQASHDGMCSPIAVLRGPDGVASRGARSAAALVVPTHLIALAPRRTLVSGIADLAVNVLAISDWEWARDLHGEPFDDYAALLARSAAELMIARRELYVPGEPLEEEDVEILVYGLVLSGLAMTLAGSSRPCSGPEHLISHAFDALGLGKGLHGEQVAVGAMLAVRLDEQRHDRLLTLLQNVGAPSSPAEIGITREDALAAVRLARRVRPDRRNRLAALLEADESFVLEQAHAAWYR